MFSRKRKQEAVEQPPEEDKAHVAEHEKPVVQPPRETKRVLDWQNEDDEERVRSLLYEYSSNGESSANDLYERTTSPQREQRVVSITPQIISSQHALWQRHKKGDERQRVTSETDSDTGQ